jgi:hypothetical protein
MTNPLIGETLLSLTQAARRLPPGRSNRPVSLSCVLRWVLNGTPGPDGKRVRLDACRVGGRWLTSVEALQRFADLLTPQLDEGTVLTPRTPGKRRTASERASKELEAAGI